MDRESANWRPMGEPATSEEAAALDTFRKLLPDDGVVAWTNVFFTDSQGASHEVDAILLSSSGLFLIEFKGWHGQITGNQQYWTVTTNGGRRREERNPLNATDHKAKRLKGLLDGSRRGHLAARPPFVQPLVVLHGRDSRVDLTPPVDTRIYALDGYHVRGVPPVSDIIAGGTTDNRPVDGQSFHLALGLFDVIGMHPRPKVRHIGLYRLDDADPVDTGVGWSDYAVSHPSLPNHRRRIRVFEYPRGASKADRQRISRAARREYLLTCSLRHPGITSALEFIDDGENPPAIVFPLDDNAQPLDEWLAAAADHFTLADRLRLIRAIAEILVFAHRNGTHHRGLGPAAIRVTAADADTVTGGSRAAGGAAGAAAVTIRDWQTGTAIGDPDGPADTALVGVTNVPDLAEQSQWIYLAPEAHSVAHPDGTAMDVYGLGALAYLILTGEPPAPNFAELDTRLGSGGLDVTADADALPDDLVELVKMATAPSVSERLATIDDFLDFLSDAERYQASRDTDPDPVLDPLDATTDSVLEDTWIVTERLGSGSTGLALKVSRGIKGEPEYVLKVALDESKAQRLIDEADVLASLDHPLVVKVIEGPFMMHGRTCVLLENAGSPTIGQRIRSDGRLALENMANYGADMFEILRSLDEHGVHHRDIKPDNFAVRRDSAKRPRLTIFDFSLAREKMTNIRSGTQPYLDPFLGPRFKRPTYDSAAERFAVAVTLFEMACGHTPSWGDGQSAPELIDDEVTVTADLFDDPTGEAMADFFRRALARRAADRFGDIDEMASAWGQIFTAPVTTVQGTEVTDEDRERAAATVTESTPLADAGLTPHALSAARRLRCETVADVISLDAMAINQQVGLGQRTRRELQRRRKQWTEVLRAGTWVEEGPAYGRSVEQLNSRLIPRGNAANRDAVALARIVAADADWTPLRQLARDADLDPGRAAAAFQQLRNFWAKRVSALAEVAAEVQACLAAVEGIATLDEVVAYLVAHHGSQLVAAHERHDVTVPLVRAVAEAQDTLLDGASLTLDRAEADAASPMLLALTDEGAEPVNLRLIRDLGTTVDAATAIGDGLVSANDSTALVTPTALEIGVNAGRLVRLAASVSADSDASTRGELYRRGLAPAMTVARVLHGGGTSILAVATLAERVRKRYPRAAPLPSRPALDDIVGAVVPGLTWDGHHYSRALSASMLSAGTRMTMLDAGTDRDVADAVERLTSSLQTRSGVVIAIDPRQVDAAADALTARFEVVEVNLAAELIAAAKRYGDAHGVAWQFLLAQDAAPAAGRDTRLDTFMAAALATFWDATMARTEPLLLTDAAVLARYGLTDRLAAVTNLATPLPAARWILVPHRTTSAVPTLDGTSIPLPANGWLTLPNALIRSVTVESGRGPSTALG